MPAKVRNVIFVLLGVAALVLKKQYAGPFAELVYSYGGNVAASFAVYFIVGVLPFPARSRKLLTTFMALLVVELFEVTDGFGVMSNVYDRADLAANVLGVGLALAIDSVASRISTGRFRQRERTPTKGEPGAGA
jgi:hypothetical protein